MNTTTRALAATALAGAALMLSTPAHAAYSSPSSTGVTAPRTVPSVRSGVDAQFDTQFDISRMLMLGGILY